MHDSNPTRPVVGFVCPKCKGRDMKVFYTRNRVGCVIRSRKCTNCGKRLLTKERAVGEG